MKKVIGITGSIATGKSSVSNYIKSKGYVVIDSDELVHKLYLKDGILYNKLISYFGESIKGIDQIDRNALRNIVFNDMNKLQALNSITHPIIFDELKKVIESLNVDLIFIDVPLLFEAGFEKLCDKVVVVYTNIDIEIKRLMKRDNINKDEAYLKISKQIGIEAKAKRADYVIDNSRDFNNTKKQIDELLERI